MRDAQWIEPAEGQGEDAAEEPQSAENAERNLPGRAQATTVLPERSSPSAPLQRGPTGRVNLKDL